MIQLITLKPEDLCNPEIINYAEQNKVILLINDADEPIQTMAGQMMRLLMPLKENLSYKINMRNVREYIIRLVEDNFDLCDSCMKNPAKRTKLMCQVVGSLSTHRVLRGSARELAMMLPLRSYCLESRRRYINDGKHRIEFLESFMAVDDVFPNHPSHLCSSKQKCFNK